MRQHCAFRAPGRSARVLQASEIARILLDASESVPTGCNRFAEAVRAVEPVRLDHSLDVAHCEIHDQAFREPEQVADLGHDDVLDMRVGDRS